MCWHVLGQCRRGCRAAVTQDRMLRWLLSFFWLFSLRRRPSPQFSRLLILSTLDRSMVVDAYSRIIACGETHGPPARSWRPKLEGSAGATNFHPLVHASVNEGLDGIGGRRLPLRERGAGHSRRPCAGFGPSFLPTRSDIALASRRLSGRHQLFNERGSTPRLWMTPPSPLAMAQAVWANWLQGRLRQTPVPAGHTM